MYYVIFYQDTIHYLYGPFNSYKEADDYGSMWFVYQDMSYMVTDLKSPSTIKQ